MKFLRNVLDSYFLNCVNFLEKILREVYVIENLNGIILDKNEKFIKRDDVSFKRFSFELFCIIF